MILPTKFPQKKLQQKETGEKRVWQKFDAAASRYDRASFLQQQAARHLLDLMGTVVPGSIWLDAGCGTGVLAKALANQEARVWAVDLAPNMLKALEYDDRIQTILADIRNLPLADDMLDGAVSSFALHWLGATIIEEILRVIQPGGEAWLAVPVQGSLAEVTARYPGLPVFAFEPAQCWLAQAGSTVQYWETRRFSQSYSSLKALISAIRQMGGNESGQAPSTTSKSQWKQWLGDQTPIDLSFEVLFLHLKKPATDHALAFLYES
ncbi:methyltransferase domain-containing protein [Alkanindiges sp. WGS2144]|uniref:methyltransferase domain-containing protein n=1 Tax=Alkanindiges sp. WGS2144 TaxID=3366808 RepID=UPI0037519B7B